MSHVHKLHQNTLLREEDDYVMDVDLAQAVDPSLAVDASEQSSVMNSNQEGTVAFNAIPSFISITLKENHIANPAVLAGHYLYRRTQSPGVLEAQWLEHPSKIMEIVGLIPS